jgi:ABC-type transporter Mla MlaB component
MIKPFTIESCSEHGTARLRLGGEFDHAGIATLEAAFERLGSAHGPQNVVIDLANLEFCDSAAWHALERCRDDGATLAGDPACLRRLFYLIRHADKLPPELHELRGLQPDAARRLVAA